MKKRKYTEMKASAGSDSDSDSEDDNPEIVVQQNHLYFWCDVTKKSCLDFTLKLGKVFSRLRNTVLVGEPIPPIYIHVNSDGGDLYAAIGLVDTIDSLKKSGANIVTIAEGYVASAATMIVLSGNDRRIRHTAYMRIHQFRSGMYGKKSEMDDEHENNQKLGKDMETFYKKRTKMSKKTIKKILKRELDLTAQECIEHGLVEKIQE
jgi:ATP-dependent protease ClpP protease subunit